MSAAIKPLAKKGSQKPGKNEKKRIAKRLAASEG